MGSDGSCPTRVPASQAKPRLKSILVFWNQEIASMTAVFVTPCTTRRFTWSQITQHNNQLEDGINAQQGRTHIFKVGGPIPWSRVLLPFYRKIRQLYPVWCSRLHNHTLSKSYVKSWGSVQILGRSKPLPTTPSGCAHDAQYSWGSTLGTSSPKSNSDFNVYIYIYIKATVYAMKRQTTSTLCSYNENIIYSK